MDSHTDDLDKLAAETEALLNEPEQTQQPDKTLLGLAESVAVVNQVNVNTNKSLQRALASIEAAPGQLAQSVDASLKQLEKERRALRAQTAQLRAQNRSGLMAMVGGFLMLGGATFAIWYFFLSPKIADFKSYKESHRLLEVGSVFGARVIEQDGRRFVVFDDGVVVQACGKEYPNCVSLETN